MSLALRVLVGSILAVGLTGAKAADLPANKAAPADFAKVCNVGGMAGFVLPGSDACVKISGFVTGGIAIGAPKTAPNWTLAPGAAAAAPYPYAGARTAFGSIADFSIDIRQDTPNGVMRGYAEGSFNNYAGFGNPGGATINRAFVQYGGFTIGKTNSFFSFIGR
ncbi:MAG TPA: porin [Roseiarcus sp.]|nr:porin [Roseiarcus sp.]